MPHRRRVAKARAEAIYELRRQGNFRHQHQGLPPRSQRLGDGFEINFGLTRSGDAVEQRDAKPVLFHACPQRIGGNALVGRQIGRGVTRIEPARARHAPPRRYWFQQSFRRHGLDHGCADARFFRQI